MKGNCFALNLSPVHLGAVIPALWHTSLRVWAGFVWLRVQKKVSLWSRRALVPGSARSALGMGRDSFSL